MCLEQVHEHVALVAQEPQLFGCSILENLCYDMEPQPQMEDVFIACKLAHAHSFISDMDVTTPAAIASASIDVGCCVLGWLRHDGG